MKTNMPQTKRSKIDGRKYPWPHNAMVQPIKPIAAPLWAKAPKRPAAAFWGDTDKDGVMNAFDCAPRNPRRQGPEHTQSINKESIKKMSKEDRDKLIEWYKNRFPEGNFEDFMAHFE